MVKQGFTKPALSECGGDLSKEWFVHFRFTCPSCQARKQYQYRGTLNYLSSVVKRREYGQALAYNLLRAMERGWNPHHESIEEFTQRSAVSEQLKVITAMRDIGNMSFNQALDYAFQKKKPNLAKKSVSSIGGVKDFAKVAAIKLGFDQMPVKDTKRVHIKLLLDQIGKDRQAEYDKEGKGKTWTGNAYNKYKGFLQVIFLELTEYEAIEYNPCDKIKNRLTITTNVHRHATDKEREAIKAHLRHKAPRFYIYLVTEYLTGIRPNELMGVKVGDIDTFNQCIDIHPKEGGAKNRKARKVPMPNVLLKYLERLDLDKHEATDYVFSRGFRPGPERCGRDYPTKLWKELVKDGLGLNVSLYSFKGLGGEDKRKAGIPVDVVSIGFGHASVGQSLTYLHGERGRVTATIIEHTPDL